MKSLRLQAFGRCEGPERTPTQGMSPEERREHMRSLSRADSGYVVLSAAVGRQIAEVP